ncbi:MAG: hypothetical protein RX318_07880 [bacterium]|nr:hypothetical protein [bacterium]
MKRTSLVFLTVLMVSAWAVSSARAFEYSPKTRVYVIEYLTPASVNIDAHFGTIEPHPGTKNPHILNLLLLIEASPEKAEALLRSEMAVIGTLFPPEGDILAAAWIRLTGDPADEKLIYFPDGSCHLVYSKKENRVHTSRKHLGMH